jgi:hypothetical protein
MRPAIAVVLVVALAACGVIDGPVAIRTRGQPDDTCLQARVGGTLVADSTFGLAFQNDGYRNGIVWPYGYSARRQSGVIVLVGPSGAVVAREGDRILAAGGSSGEDAVGVYCSIKVNPSPGG